jgi:hypothetical protein
MMDLNEGIIEGGLIEIPKRSLQGSGLAGFRLK